MATPRDRAGRRFARQVLPADASPSHVARSGGLAESRTLYLNRDGILIVPGNNDAGNDVSSIVREPSLIYGWDVDDDTWDETVACVTRMYARFDVRVTDEDPGDVPHIEAVFGGHPNDVGLPDDVAGVSPFREDCGTIENSIVFTFTDVLPDDPQVMCEVMSQEIAHSFGLDHEMLPSDPMTYLDYAHDRSFQDQMASCGEFGNRQCGINGSVCRARQNSVALLASRLGWRGDDAPPGDLTTTTGPEAGGCATSGSGAPLGGMVGMVGMVVFGLVRRRRRLR
ncbi:MAG: hypothetical protein KIT31_17025 [Deltaproteobacteria bacterium]|nr:hypothetical protein [Deltaproteobacteria bacterium]